MKMTIKKRLAVSNLLMLLIPVAVVLVAGIVFLAILFSIISSNGFRFGEERFYDHKDEIMTLIGDCLDSDTPTDSLNGLIDSAGQANMRIIVAENGQILYKEGNSSASDEKLLAMTVGGEGLFVSDDIRQLYTATLVQGDRTFGVSVFCNYSALPEQALETALAAMVLSLIVLVAISIIIANRLLSRSVFRKIERPLDKLLAGAR